MILEALQSLNMIGQLCMDEAGVTLGGTQLESELVQVTAMIYLRMMDTELISLVKNSLLEL